MICLIYIILHMYADSYSIHICILNTCNYIYIYHIPYAPCAGILTKICPNKITQFVGKYTSTMEHIYIYIYISYIIILTGAYSREWMEWMGMGNGIIIDS